ncbi:MAG: DeoR/GlpR family DNA-binding transcription regulator [Anditalea sp.]
MGISERHQQILKRLKEEGKVHIQELSEEMQVSNVTIRKDLKFLEDMNLLFRTRGGGSLNNPYTMERSINEKALINAGEKQKIAKAALQLIDAHETIIIGSGTTVFELAKQLHPSRQITVITPAAKVTLELSNRLNIELFQLGGTIRPKSSSVVGSSAESALENISCGLLFLGVDGIDLDFGLSTTILNEASLGFKMIESAQTVVIMADSTKFNKRGLAKICGLDQIHYIITDSKAPAKAIRVLEDKGIRVIIANGQ